MKTASHIARILLGLIFTVFGLNGFLHFIPLPLPSDVAGQFMGALFVSHYYVAVFAVQVAGGILLLSNRFVPLALTLAVELGEIGFTINNVAPGAIGRLQIRPR